MRTVARMPGRDGGEAHQGSVVWGGAVGAGGHMTVGVDILARNEIVGSTREHSRSEWSEGGSFAEAKNVSVGGNTVYVFDRSERELRSVALGECDPALGYTYAPAARIASLALAARQAPGSGRVNRSSPSVPLHSVPLTTA